MNTVKKMHNFRIEMTNKYAKICLYHIHTYRRRYGKHFNQMYYYKTFKARQTQYPFEILINTYIFGSSQSYGLIYGTEHNT